jgi:thiosulfate/3-mercaptopyruvate sulfurtransferase
MKPLITAGELAASIERPVICDIRWDLTDPAKGKETYLSGHIPGAVFVNLDVDLAGEPGLSGRHPLPKASDFTATLGRLGIDPDSQVVVYDDVGGRVAARLWWMLLSIGHQTVQVLDGGYQAWVAGGHEIATDDVQRNPVTYPAPIRFVGVVSYDQVPDRVVVDARAGERYRGEVEPVDPKAGHIPGAINIPTSANLTDDGRFETPEHLADLYADVPDGAAVSCGSGVNACHGALAMVVAGRDLPDVYVGSFSEWSRRDLSVETGAHP